MTLEEFRRTKEQRKLLIQKRKLLFISCGLKPLQVALAASVWSYVLSVVFKVCHFWPRADLSRMHLLGLLALPALSILSWRSTFRYTRSPFLGLAAAAGGIVTVDIFHPGTDIFFRVGLLTLIAVMVVGYVIFVKMKDPAFSKLDGA